MSAGGRTDGKKVLNGGTTPRAARALETLVRFAFPRMGNLTAAHWAIQIERERAERGDTAAVLLIHRLAEGWRNV